MNESSLHLELKNRLSQRGDILEANVNGYKIDIKRGNMLIEIQTRSLSKIKPKLIALLAQDLSVQLIHPIPQEKWIVKIDSAGKIQGRRKSPKHGRIEHMFYEVVSISSLFKYSGFSLVILLYKEEEFRKNDGRGSWRRRGWSILDRQLLDIVTVVEFNNKSDFYVFIPDQINYPFTNKEIAEKLKIPVNLARKMTYSLREIGILEIVGKRGNSFLMTPIDEIGQPDR